jgi:uncharacterized membrane protein YkvA (DUF1232 family)
VGLQHWRDRARTLKREVYTLYFAYRDPRVPWYAKLFAGCVVGYVLSPIDLIPDFIPVLGYLDELILVPLAVLAARRMIPAAIMADAQARAEAMKDKPVNRVAAGVIVVVWLALAAAGIWLVLRVAR